MHVIVPLDESERSLSALPIARLLALHTGAELTLLSVVAGPAMPGQTRELAEFQQAVTTVERELSGLTIHTTVRVGDPASQIMQLAREVQAELIVMSIRGRSGAGRALLGSVADEVMRASWLPVVLLHPNGREVEKLKTIVVPLDGTPGDAVATAAAVPLARSAGAKLMLVQATAKDPSRTCVEGMITQLQATGVQVEGCSTHVRPAMAILTVADEVDADLIVMSTHARSGLVRSMLGSVADEVVRRSHRPVLLVRRQQVGPPKAEWWVIEPQPAVTGRVTSNAET